MSDDLDAVRQELAAWVAANEQDAIRLELARRGVEVDPSPIDEEFEALSAELKSRLLAAEVDPRRLLAEAVAALAQALAGIVAPPPPPPVPVVVVKTVERDAEGLIARIVEEQQ